MPQQGSEGTGSGGGARARLRARIDAWEEIRERIAALNQQLEGADASQAQDLETIQARLDALIEQRSTLNEQIVGIVRNHPNLYDYAVDLGYNENILKRDPDTQSGDSSTGGGGGNGSGSPPRGDNDGNGGGGSGNNNSGGGGGNNGGGGGGGNGDGGDNKNDRLTGKLGRDYVIVRRDGKTYAMYIGKMKNGKQLQGLFRIPDKALDHYGVGKNEGRQLTDAQWQRLKKWRFGLVTDIKLNGQHPIRNFLEQTAERFGIAPAFLRNKGVMETLLEAHLEGWDSSRILGALRSTDWYKTKTETRLNYIMEKSPAERESLIENTYLRLKDAALTQFAGVNYQDTVSDEQLRTWAKKVASGAIGWDEASALFKLQQMARGVEGSAAWFQNQQQTTAVGNSVEDRQAQLRDSAISWLGYSGRPDNSVLNTWAKELVAGTKSEADWDKFMRNQAQNLHRYLGPDEKFMDAQAAYRQMAEQAFGRSLHPNDPLLEDLSLMNPDGTRDPEQRMSFQDFRRFMAKDDRFWDRGSMGHTQSTELASEIASIFGGVNF